jgi:hypothetical protein
MIKEKKNIRTINKSTTTTTVTEINYMYNNKRVNHETRQQKPR